MNLFDTTTNGGMPLSNNDFQFMQAYIRTALAGLSMRRNNLGVNIDHVLLYPLRYDNSGSGSTIRVYDNWIFYNSELWYIPETELTLGVWDPATYGVKYTTGVYLTDGLKAYKNAASVDTHEVRTAIPTDATTISPDVVFNDVVNHWEIGNIHYKNTVTLTTQSEIDNIRNNGLDIEAPYTEIINTVNNPTDPYIFKINANTFQRFTVALNSTGTNGGMLFAQKSGTTPAGANVNIVPSGATGTLATGLLILHAGSTRLTNHYETSGTSMAFDTATYSEDLYGHALWDNTANCMVLATFENLYDATLANLFNCISKSFILK